MARSKQIGLLMQGASILALVIFILVFGLMPHQEGLRLAKWTVRTRFPDVRQISTPQSTCEAMLPIERDVLVPGDPLEDLRGTRVRRH